MAKKKMVVAVLIVLLAILLNIYICVWLPLGENALAGKLLLCALVDAVAVICTINVESLLRVPLEILKDRAMFLTLVKNDLQAKFAGSYLGRIWAYVHPLVTIVLYWFVFQFGLRSGNVSNHPFILFLMAGLVPWFYFSEAWNGASASLLEYNYLVKKVVFNVSFLPILKVCSALFVHVFF